jgi:hypothetical protein
MKYNIQVYSCQIFIKTDCNTDNCLALVIVMEIFQQILLDGSNGGELDEWDR